MGPPLEMLPRCVVSHSAQVITPEGRINGLVDRGAVELSRRADITPCR